MFRFNPFAPLGPQRQALLAAKSFESIPLHPAVQRQLDLSLHVDRAPKCSIETKFQLFCAVLAGIRDLVIEVVILNVVAAGVVLCAVFVAREVFQATAGLAVGVALTALFLALKLSQAFIDYRSWTTLLQIHRGVQISLYRLINQKLARIAPSGRSQFSKGQLKTLIGSDVEAVEDFLSSALAQWSRAIVSCVVVIPVLWFVSGSPGLVALVVVLAIIPVSAFGAAIVEKFQAHAQAEQDLLVTAIGEWVKNIRLVRFLGWNRTMQSEINAKMWRFIVRAAIRHSAVIVVWAISYSWSMFPVIAIFAVSLSQTTPLNLTEVFSSLWFLNHLMVSLQYIPHSLSLFGSASAGAERILALLRQPELQDSLLPTEGRSPSPTAIPTRLILKDVRVHRGGHEVLKGISVVFALHEKLVILGPVASGKSTLLEVLLGEIPLTSGSIDVEFSDGSCAPLWRRDVYAAVRSMVAFSPQQPFLSNALMRDNIDLSAAATLEEVQMAASMSQLDEDLALFPHGLFEEVGESGINLSGGQKQRVSLARAFASKRTLWILDDPLSAVDSQTEHKLIGAIMSRCSGLILVSHRIGVLQYCDRVLVLDNGVFIEDGDPKNLSVSPNSQVYRYVRALEEHAA